VASRFGALVHFRLLARRLARAQVIPLAKEPACLVVVVTAVVLLLASRRSLRSGRHWTDLPAVRAHARACGLRKQSFLLPSRLLPGSQGSQLHAGYEASSGYSFYIEKERTRDVRRARRARGRVALMRRTHTHRRHTHRESTHASRGAPRRARPAARAAPARRALARAQN
jgi:hypothetical protein